MNDHQHKFPTELGFWPYIRQTFFCCISLGSFLEESQNDNTWPESMLAVSITLAKYKRHGGSWKPLDLLNKGSIERSKLSKKKNNNNNNNNNKKKTQ